MPRANSSVFLAARCSGSGSLRREPLGELAQLEELAARRPAAPGSADSPPTGGAIDMSLSLRITTRRLPAASALFIAS